MGEPLVTVEEVAAGWAGFASLDQAYQEALIASATRAAETHCGRPLGLASYAEVYRPARSRLIRLPTYPLVSIDRVAADLEDVLTIRNTSGSASRAIVTISPTSLTLRVTISGVATQASFGLGEYPTVGDLAGAISAAGSGWSASASGTYLGWATSDLIIEPGTFGALREEFALRAYVRDLSDYIPDFKKGVIELREGFARGFRYPDRMHGGDPRWGGVFVAHSAGYATGDAPADLKAAVRHMAKAVNDIAKATGIYQSETLGARSWTLGDLEAPIASRVEGLLSGYVDWRVA